MNAMLLLLSVVRGVVVTGTLTEVTRQLKAGSCSPGPP